MQDTSTTMTATVMSLLVLLRKRLITVQTRANLAASTITTTACPYSSKTSTSPVYRHTISSKVFLNKKHINQ